MQKLPRLAPLLLTIALSACQTLIDVDHPLRFDAAAVGSPDRGALETDAATDAPEGLAAPPVDAASGPDAPSSLGEVSLPPPLPGDFRLPPPLDAAATPDARPPPLVEDCHDTVDNDEDSRADCADPDCAQEPCDDGAPCTFDDRCDAVAGQCVGTALQCESDACMLRGCTGGSTCAETPVDEGAPCNDDGDPCTDNVCDGRGTCGVLPRPEGAFCRGETYEFRCCRGACANVFTDDANCGGCGINCGGRGCVADAVGLIPRISCNCGNSNAQCQAIHPDYTCFENRCNCLSDAACGPGMQCVNITNSPNTCLFP